MSAKLDGQDVPDSPFQEAEASEIEEAMVAVAAAAHALDGFYGSVSPVVPVHRRDAARARHIIETLKMGFYIGKEWQGWQREVDWLFRLRDSTVHHAEKFQPLVLVRQTGETNLLGARELFDFSADGAGRAARLAVEIIATCLKHPKPALVEWSQPRRGIIETLGLETAKPMNDGA